MHIKLTLQFFYGEHVMFLVMLRRKNFRWRDYRNYAWRVTQTVFSAGFRSAMLNLNF